MTEKKAKEVNTLAKKKDKSNEFLIGATVFLLMVILVYKLFLSTMLVNMDIYHQALRLYDRGEHIKAGKLFGKLGSYKDAEERYQTSYMEGIDQLVRIGETAEARKHLRRLLKEIQSKGENTTKVQEYRKALEKKAFHLYMDDDETDLEKVRYLYRDMDGDGSLECCEIRPDGRKYMYTCKDGKVYSLNDCNESCYLVSWIYEKHNLFSVMSLNSEGMYIESFYTVNGTELENLAEKIIAPTNYGYSDIAAFLTAMRNVECGQEYKISDDLIAYEEYYKEGEMCSEEEYASYIIKITENERGIEGAKAEIPGWEVENGNGEMTFYGKGAYYGGYSTAGDFIQYCLDYYEDDYDYDYDYWW